VHRGLQGGQVVGHPVVAGVLVGDALEDGQGLLGRGFGDLDGLEAPRQGGVLLDEAAVLVVGGGADAGELPAGQRGLELVGGVLGALAGGPGAD
jgi:hypothetical protein